MERGGCVYIMTNKSNSTVYVGVTSDLPSRVNEHKTNRYPGSFTSRYKCYKLVYFETFHSIEEAISREKEIKGWLRSKKDTLIDHSNPERKDLFSQVLDW
ncbi:MAG: GIY-YIG nuclease family protein [Cyclobacteriaceae bacterium]